MSTPFKIFLEHEKNCVPKQRNARELEQPRSKDIGRDTHPSFSIVDSIGQDFPPLSLSEIKREREREEAGQRSADLPLVEIRRDR